MTTRSLVVSLLLTSALAGSSGTPASSASAATSTSPTSTSPTSTSATSTSATSTAAAIPASGEPRDPLVAPPWAGRLRSAARIDTGAAPYPSGTSAYSMTYLSMAPDGRRATVGGLLLVPPGPAPSGGWPVVAWDHGTTGIGDDCAPSSMEGAAYGHLLGQVLRRGYAVSATDYPGLGTPGVHPYLISRSAAFATIDAVRAARQIVPTLSTGWFAVGHSQGGQAAVATAEWAEEYAGARLRLLGAVAFAPAPNMSGLADDIASAHPLEQQFYAMMLVGLKTQHPGLRWSDYLGPRARKLLPEVRTRCFDELTGVFVAAGLPASEFEPRDQAAVDRLRRWFAANEIGHRRADAPLLVAQGSADQVVPEAATSAMVAASRDLGSTIDYRVYAGATHGSVLTEAETPVLDWLDRQDRRRR